MEIRYLISKLKDKIFTLTKGKIRFKGQITLEELNKLQSAVEEVSVPKKELIRMSMSEAIDAAYEVNVVQGLYLVRRPRGKKIK